MQRLEVSGAVRLIYGSLGVKRIKYMLEVFNRRVFITVSTSEYGQQAGYSEHVNGSSYSIKCEEFID